MTYNWTTQDLQDLQPRPIELAETIPAKWFTNVDLYQFELNSVFSKSWQYVLPLSSIRNLGDVWAGTLLEKPVLLVKVSSTEIRCFANVCRHRGGPLIKEHGVSNTRIFRCAYHSWTYDLSGKLVGAPKFDGAQEFEKKTCKLPEYKVEVVYGMIFVNLNENAESMKPLFDKVSSTISPIDMNEMNFYQRVEYKVKCNWKVYIDNYMEGYHISPVHPGLAKILQLDGYKTTIDGPSILQYGPLANENNPYHTAGAAYYYQIFPNLMLNILPGRMQVNSIVPIDVDHCMTIFDFYYSETDPKKLKIKADDDLQISDLVQKEDIEICEHVQVGLKSGAYSKGRICPDEELGVWAFQNNLRRFYKENMNG